MHLKPIICSSWSSSTPQQQGSTQIVFSYLLQVFYWALRHFQTFPQNLLFGWYLGLFTLKCTDFRLQPANTRNTGKHFLLWYHKSQGIGWPGRKKVQDNTAWKLLRLFSGSHLLLWVTTRKCLHALYVIIFLELSVAAALPFTLCLSVLF